MNVKSDDQLIKENESLRERLSRFAETGIRINEDLDLDAVLQSVLDSARVLSHARYGVITLQDDDGTVQDFLSSGMTANEARLLWDVPESEKIFENLNSFPGPARLRDLRSYISSLGISGFEIPLGKRPSLSFLTVPLHHMGRRVGNIFVAEKESADEFSAQDEETLRLFASQAALVISNVRASRAEHRARADYETLMNTSPVGVVVVHLDSGAVISFNREARRMTENLWSSGQSTEEVLDSVTILRADGREISFNETSLADILKSGEIARVEEVIAKVPDGRSVTLLVNATPIRAENGSVESYVVTLQDLAPIKKLERLRAEFLGIVSHELRDPLTSIKGSVTTLMQATNDLELAEMVQFFRIIDEQTDRMRDLIGELLEVARIVSGTLSMRPEPADLVELIDEAKSRFLSGGGRDSLAIDLGDRLPRVMADRRRIVQVLGNLLSNAEKFSADSTKVQIAAARKEHYVEISVVDRGRGIDPNVLPHLFSKFANHEARSEDGGFESSGIGLAICKGIVEAHGGRIWAESEGPGLGARFSFTLPALQGEPTDVPGVATGSSTSADGTRHPSSAARILAVDDDPQFLRYVRKVLERAGYAPVATGDFEEVPKLMLDNRPKLVLLDLLLPGTNGIELMKRISATDDVPVIFLSAYRQDEVVAKAFELGAADYIVKPFSESELVARIGAALRRRISWRTMEPHAPYVRHSLSIDYDEHRVVVSGRVVDLTATEYSLLYVLSANAPRVIGYDEILQRIWRERHDPGRGLVRTVVKRLRRKLRDDAVEPRYIFTVPGVGYRMSRSDSSTL